MSDSQAMTDIERYRAACHAVQSGVMSELGYDPSSGTPKHLRTGVNIAMTDLGSITRLLVSKGLLTIEEIDKALADGMEAEKQRYEKTLSDHFQSKITLA